MKKENTQTGVKALTDNDLSGMIPREIPSLNGFAAGNRILEFIMQD